MNNDGLRVVVLTRTGRLSGMRLARAIGASRHTLCGIVAERRFTMMKNVLRQRSAAAFVDRYGWRLIMSRLWESVTGMLATVLAGSRKQERTRLATGCPVATMTVTSLNSIETVTLLTALQPDILVVANAPVLKSSVFGCARLGAINFHSGRLPEYGGVASEFWSLYTGEEETWSTIHKITDDLDSGDILGETSIAIMPDDTPETLHLKAVEVGEGLVVDVLNRLAAGEDTPVRTPGPAVLLHWPTSRQRHELRCRLRAKYHNTHR